jgi:protein-glutamine gamma-glutamyltransferase
MNSAARELNSIVLTAVAPLPFYFTGAINPAAVMIFHAVLLMIAAATIVTRAPVTHPRVVRFTAYAYLFFFPLNIVMARGDLIRPSTNLLFFIAIYLLVEQRWSENYGKRLLIAFLLFVASIATSTHLGVVPFVVVFSFLAFRELIAISHAATAAALQTEERHSVPSVRASAFYVAVCAAGAIVIFPFLPRLEKSVLRGLTAGMQSSSTGLSDSIDFSSTQRIIPDADVVARVWMGRESVPFFTPLRLRGVVYDAFERGKWVTAHGNTARVRDEVGVIPIARPEGFTRTLTIQQQPLRQRLLLPVGTYVVADMPRLMKMPGGTYSLSGGEEKPVEFRVGVARQTLPIEQDIPQPLSYRMDPRVADLTAGVVESERRPDLVARRIEEFFSSGFTYLADPSEIGKPMTVEEFLLDERRGHCEYFAAGMVVMLTSAGVPARIVGGFYGGERNPLTGYFTLRSRDAHAWVEVWSGDRWLTFDPTPEALRPGGGTANLIRQYASALGDSVEFVWDRYILTFGTEEQVVLITSAIAAAGTVKEKLAAVAATLRRVATLQLFIVLLLAAAVGVLLRSWVHQRRQSALDAMIEQLRRMGIGIDASATGSEIVERIEGTRPDLAEAAAEIVRVHQLEKFSGRPVGPELQATSKRALVTISAAAR